jgi:Tfp pilus assembly protein PilV
MNRQHSSYLGKMRIHRIRSYYGNASTGVSLVEVLLMLSLLAITLMPASVVVSQAALNSRAAYIQSSRALLLSDFRDEMDSDRLTYQSLFNDAAMNTGLSDSGQVIPFMRKVDVSNSDTFKRTVYFYQYASASDLVISPQSKVTLVQTVPEFRLSCGRTAGQSGEDESYCP